MQALLLAVCPIGLPTIVLSATRVAGPLWLKSFIGRAKESTAMVEVELLSSTSHEVCEPWNGSSVVRVMGKSSTKEFMVLRRRTARDKDRRTKAISFQEAKRGGLVVRHSTTVSRLYQRFFPWSFISCVIDKYYAFIHRSAKADQEQGLGHQPTRPITCQSSIEMPEMDPSRLNLSNPDHHTIIIATNSRRGSPSISLNIRPLIEGRARVICFMVSVVLSAVAVGMLVVLFLLGYAREKGGKPVPTEALVTYCVGTYGLCIVTFLLYLVIEYGAESGIDQPHEDWYLERLVWLQPAGVVNDQRFNANAIFPQRQSNLYIRSFRGDGNFAEKNLIGPITVGTLTVISSFLCIAGFLIQAYGIRSSNSSIGQVYLLLTIMALVNRGVAYKSLSELPETRSLAPGYEIEWLAKELVSDQRGPWNALPRPEQPSRLDDSGSDRNNQPRATQSFPTPNLCLMDAATLSSTRHEWSSQGQRALEMRGDLVEASGHVSPQLPLATNLSRDMQETLNLLVKGDSNSFTWPEGSDQQAGTLLLNLSIGSASVGLELHYEKGLNGSVKWSVPPQQLDSVISLWLYEATSSAAAAAGNPSASTGTLGFTTEQQTNQRGTKLRLLGSVDPNKRPNLLWFIPPRFHDSAKLLTPNVAAQFNIQLTTNGQYSDTHPGLWYAESDSPQNIKYAQYILASLVLALAEQMRAPVGGVVKFRSGVESLLTSDSDSLLLRNETISGLVQNIHECQIGSLEEIYFLVVSIFRHHDKLPAIKNVFDEVLAKAQAHEQLGEWEKAFSYYTALFRKGGSFVEMMGMNLQVAAMILTHLTRVDERQQMATQEERVFSVTHPYLSKTPQFREIIHEVFNDEICGHFSYLTKKQGEKWNKKFKEVMERCGILIKDSEILTSCSLHG